MANASTMTLTISVRWWLKRALQAIVIIDACTGWRPSDGRMDALILRGLYVK